MIATAKADQSLEVGYAFSPYGQTQKVGVEGEVAGSENSSQYTGRENDGNGLYFYRARYYDPVLKRFTSEDPIGLAGGINSYSYVGGNPLSFTDPLGLQASGGGLPNFNPTTPDQCEVASIWDLITKKRKKTDCSATMPTHTTCRACCTAKAMNGNYYELGTVCEAQCDDTKYPDNPINPGPKPTS